mgnify:CR=1 FL=1
MEHELSPAIRGLIAFAIYGSTFFSLERLFPLHRRVRKIRPALATDLTHLFVTRLLVNLIVGAVVFGFVVKSMEAGFFAQGRATVESWPMFIHVIVFMLYWSFVSYWDHRLSHRWQWRWKFHAIHHSAKEMDWLVSPRLHPIDQAIHRLIQFAPPLFIGIHIEAIIPYLALAGILALLYHANVRWSLGSFNVLIASTHWHHWHHALEPRNKNFSGLFPIWDLLFGTYYCPKDEWPTAYGISEDIDENWLAHMRYPFQAALSKHSRMLRNPENL